MAYTRDFNSIASMSEAAKAPNTAPVQPLLSKVSNVQVNPARAAHGIDGTKPNAATQVQPAREALTACKDQNLRTLGAVEKDLNVAKREMDSAGVAAGQGSAAGAFQRETLASDSGVELLVNAKVGAPFMGQGSVITALQKGMNAAEPVSAVLDDLKNKSCEEAQTEIADILRVSSQPAPENTADFGMITQAGGVERIDVTNDYAGIIDDYGLDGLEEIYNCDVENASSAFPELQALAAANADIDQQLAELDAIEAQAAAGYCAAGVECAGELPPGAMVETDGVDPRVPIAMLDAAEREELINQGAHMEPDDEFKRGGPDTSMNASTSAV